MKKRTFQRVPDSNIVCTSFQIARVVPDLKMSRTLRVVRLFLAKIVGKCHLAVQLYITATPTK
jgi:hypothetical protein